MKLTSILNSVSIIALSTTMLACSVYSSQFEGFTSNEQPKMQDYYWDAVYDSLNYRLIAIEMPNGTLFSDKFGNSFYFDGWNIESIVGFGDFEGEYDIKGDEVGSVEFNDENSFTIKKDCSEWTEVSQGNAVVYEQSCKNNGKFINKIFVNENGQIVHFRQHIGPSNKLMVLKKTYLN